jgi:cell division protein FtsW (lipid II flippase)
MSCGRRGALDLRRALVLLVIVLVPFIGKVVNGARRWIPLGVMNFQPSELAKLAIAMYAAELHGAQDGRARELLPGGDWPMAVALGFIGLLLLAEPDMGAFMVIARSRWASCSWAASTAACSCWLRRCWWAPSC